MLPQDGVIVNLHGRYRPELSVDRRQLRAYDAQQVLGMMRTALPSLLSNGWPLVTRDWLCRVCTHALPFADDVIRCAGESEVTWRDDGRDQPVATVGYFPPDTLLLRLVTGEYPEPHPSRMRSSMLVRMLPDPVLRWRLMALYATGAGDTHGANIPNAPTKVPAAMPSDLVLLSSGNARNPRLLDHSCRARVAAA